MNPGKQDPENNPLEKKVLELETLLEQSQAELQTAQSAQLRALADLENFRRRQTEDQARWSTNAVINFLRTVLPSFLELSLGASHSQDQAMTQVVEKFFNALKQQGLQSLSPEPGEPINPETHEVLMAEAGTPGTVIRCLEVGWQYNGQVIVPAKVSGATT